jgi:hypothetical protein
MAGLLLLLLLLMLLTLADAATDKSLLSKNR